MVILISYFITRVAYTVFCNYALFLLISRVTCTALINHIIIYISDLYQLFESYASHTSPIHSWVPCAEACTSYKYVLHAAWQRHFSVQKTTLSVSQYEDIIYQYLCTIFVVKCWSLFV